jgi:hypothetical protein
LKVVIRVVVKNLEGWPIVGGGQIYPLRFIQHPFESYV